MRVIDADELHNALFRAGGDIKLNAFLIFEKLILDAPTITPVKRGEWLRHENVDKFWFRCSVCRDVYFLPKKYNFCPCCGADMRGENNG